MGNVEWENNGLDESMEAFTRNNLLIKRGEVLCFALKSKCFFTVRKTWWKISSVESTANISSCDPKNILTIICQIRPNSLALINNQSRRKKTIQTFGEKQRGKYFISYLQNNHVYVYADNREKKALKRHNHLRAVGTCH